MVASIADEEVVPEARFLNEVKAIMVYRYRREAEDNNERRHLRHVEGPSETFRRK